MAGTNVTYTQAAEEQLAKGKSSLALVSTVQLYNPDLGTLSYVNAPESFTATLEDSSSVTFEPLRFELSKPTLKTDQVPEVTIGMDGIDGDLVDFLNATVRSSEETVAKIRIFNAADTTAPMQRVPMTFVIPDIAMTDTKATLKGSLGNFKNRKIFTKHYDAATHPSLSI